MRSARSLGAGRLAVFRFVYWPAIRPGLLAGGVLGFAVSFDDVVLSLFLQGPTTITLPVRMFTAIEYDLTPKIAASASVFIALAVLGLVVVNAMKHSPWATSTVFATVPIAILARSRTRATSLG